ncbi:hypothetical protein [Ferruginibacter sp.]|uniref:hypothetical protein n=1 Tax=Ferruginibacter sp. TaxID=1940288 RepID=UPI0019AB2EA8|nr:hypothetical protein [Ferruginibacter sp.]MBC7628376.1 hypothetical protein [Ferruginibacter sp.]
MFKKINWKFTVTAGAIASLLFCICAFIFIKLADYTASWILYVGSLLFFFTIAITTVKASKIRGGDESTGGLVFASLVTTIVGVLLSVLFCFLLLMIMDSGFILSGPSSKVLKDAPSTTIHSKTGGLAPELFAAATLLCFFNGAIVSVILPFYVKRTQTKDDKDPTPFKH